MRHTGGARSEEGARKWVSIAEAQPLPQQLAPPRHGQEGYSSTPRKYGSITRSARPSEGDLMKLF